MFLTWIVKLRRGRMRIIMVFYFVNILSQQNQIFLISLKNKQTTKDNSNIFLALPILDMLGGVTSD